MQSCPALLSWFLKEQPLGFPDTTPAPVFKLLLMYFSLPSTGEPVSGSEISCLEAILSTTMEYQRYFAPPLYPCPLVSTRAVLPLVVPIVTLQRFAVSLAGMLVCHPDRGTANSPELTQLLRNPASTEASLNAAAGWCDAYHQLHEQQKKRMQQQQGQPAGRGANSNRAATRSSHRSHSSSSSSRGTSSSNSMTSSSSSRTAAETLPSSLLQLDLPPDHKKLAVGFASVSARFFRSIAQSLQEGGERSDTLVAGVICLLREAMECSHEEDRGQPFSGISIPAVDCLLLLLEFIVLVGAKYEKEWRMLPLLGSGMDVLHAAISALDKSELASFVAARGELLLQLCNITLGAVNDEQQRTGGLTPPAAKCRQRVLTVLAPCAILEGKGE